MRLTGYIGLVAAIFGIIFLLTYVGETITLQNAYSYAWLLVIGLPLLASGIYLLRKALM